MKICDRCEEKVHDLASYKRPDGTQFDLCLNCELDHGKLQQANMEKYDKLRNREYEDELLPAFMMEKPDRDEE